MGSRFQSKDLLGSIFNKSRKKHAVELERLETRCLLNGAFSHGVWTIHGDIAPADRSDEIVIDVAPDDGGLLRAIINNEIIDTQSITEVQLIRVFAGKGDDMVRIELPEGADDISVKLTGGAGDDQLLGGAGDDRLIGGTGNDELDGAEGDDFLVGGRGDDVLVGVLGNDKLVGGSGDDTMKGGEGDDYLQGGRGADRIIGGTGMDRFRARIKNDWIFDNPELLPATGDPSAMAGLENLATYQELKSWYIDAAVEIWEGVFETVYQPHYYDYPVIHDFEVLFTASMNRFTEATVKAEDYSETNIQVAGVDEADLVKTDGEYLYGVFGDELAIVDVGPEDEIQVVSQTEIEGEPFSLYIYEDRLVVMSYVDPGNVFPLYKPGLLWADSILPMPYVRPRFKITEFDISNRREPEVAEETYFDGWLSNSRRIDDHVYLVINNSHYTPEPLPVEIDNTDDRYYETEQQYRERLAATFDELLPRYTTWDGINEVNRSLVSAPNVWAPDSEAGSAAYARLGEMVSVVVFEIGNDQAGPVNTTTIFDVHNNEVYASEENLYLTEGYSVWGENDLDYTPMTRIYKFTLEDDDAPLTATGSVTGTILNQFSMDEHEGYFRIATTSMNDQGETINSLQVLEQNERQLGIVGSLSNLGVSERIQAVRFLGDIGYMVTFRNIDPLFTIDLSEPAHPKVVGELKVPGFSRYLHPIDNNQLIGLGQDADVNGRVLGLQLSLFDVSNLSAPERTDTFTFNHNGNYAYSEAEWDHHAFSWFGGHNILALPVSYHHLNVVYALEVFAVTPEEGFDYLGQITHDQQIRRSLQIDDMLFSLSEDTIKVHEIDDPDQEIATLKL